MKPLNKKERAKAFYKVVGFFVVAFVIAVLLAAMTIKSPEYTESKSQGKLKQLQDQRAFLETDFAPGMQASDSLVGQMQAGGDLTQLDTEISAILVQLKNAVPEAEAWEMGMYQDIIDMISELKQAVKTNKDFEEQLASSDSDIAQKLQQCEFKNSQLELQIQTLQLQANAAAAGGGGGGGGGGGDPECEKKLLAAQNELNKQKTLNRLLKEEVDKLKRL